MLDLRNIARSRQEVMLGLLQERQDGSIIFHFSSKWMTFYLNIMHSFGDFLVHRTYADEHEIKDTTDTLKDDLNFDFYNEIDDGGRLQIQIVNQMISIFQL